MKYFFELQYHLSLVGRFVKQKSFTKKGPGRSHHFRR